MISSLEAWGDKFSYISHLLIVLGWMVIAFVLGLNPIWSAVLVSMWFYARSVREAEYNAGQKSFVSMFPWTWAPKLMKGFVGPFVLALILACLVSVPGVHAAIAQYLPVLDIKTLTTPFGVV